MIDINLNRVTKSFGFGKILDNVSLEINTGEIVSLIGENGSGKSTILKIIMGLEHTDSGTISLRKNTSIGYLPQLIEPLEEDRIVKDLLYESVKELISIEKKLKEYEQKMCEVKDKDLDKIINKYTNLQEKYLLLGGYEQGEKIGKIVKGFKINHLLEKNYNTLSGGEKRLVTFATLMVNHPDILLLDEPTNHLDIETLEWLEKYLKNYSGTVLLVSHDRYFLDCISKRIILLNQGTIDIYYGNYTYYLEEYEKRVMLEFKDYNDQQKQISKMKESIKRLREFGSLGDNEIFFKRAKAIEGRLEKMEKLSKPKQEKSIPLSFNINERSGKDVLNIKNLCISFDEHVIFKNANMEIKYKEHLALIGKNGSGKSTLIKEIINGNTCIKLGSNIKIGYIPQEITFAKDETIYDISRSYYKGEEQYLRSSLYQFMFMGDSIYKKVSKLSGGEKVRLKLFCLMQEDINFLILDEPTNHIDITTREILEDTLNKYQGTILFVSHDRYFINKVATRLVNIENEKLISYIGNYDNYIEKR